MRYLALSLLLAFTISVGFAGWEALPNSPKGGYWNHDDIVFWNDSLGWVCDISGKIYKTTDAGDSWDLVKDSPGTSFRAMAFISDSIGFVGTLGPGDWVDQTSDDTLMYKTIDGGLTWSSVTNIPNNVPISGI